MPLQACTAPPDLHPRSKGRQESEGVQTQTRRFRAGLADSIDTTCCDCTRDEGISGVRGEESVHLRQLKVFCYRTSSSCSARSQANWQLLLGLREMKYKAPKWFQLLSLLRSFAGPSAKSMTAASPPS